MIHTKDHKTLNMFEPFAHLGPKRLQLMENSWAKLFRDEILPQLPVHRILNHYDPLQGRPTKELYAMLGVMILQQMHDLTDQEAVHQFAFNLQWHYALNITSDADREAYLSPRTLWSMRSLLAEGGLGSELFETVTDKLAKLFAVETDRQRLDSMHIFSNMRHLGRVGLFVQTIKKFLVNLKRHHKELFAALGDEFTDRYLTKRGESIFAMVKPSEAAQTLESLGADLLLLVERFRQHEAVSSMSSYQLLVRLLKEQCLVEQDSAGLAKVSIKPNKQVPSDSLQHPSDPDAGYDGHKGRGYQVQVMETCGSADGQLRLITHVHAEAAHHSDTKALLPAIEATQERQLGPKEVLADTLYGSDENCQRSAKKGVTVVSPVMGNEPQSVLDLASFSYDDKGKVTACPQGHGPLITKHKKQRHSAAFSSKLCSDCPQRSDCPVKPGKHGHYLRYDDQELRVARRRAHQRTAEFKERYRLRAGVEATMSEYDRKTGVKHLRVRGLKAVQFCATLKAAGINLFRAAAFRTRNDCRKQGQRQALVGAIGQFSAIRNLAKEQHVAVWGFFFKTAVTLSRWSHLQTRLAA